MTVWIASARELHAVVVKETAMYLRAIAPTSPPSLRWRTYADVFAALDVEEANRALALGADTFDVALTLAARRLGWQYGHGRVREAVTIGRVDRLVSAMLSSSS